jgi:hypothetical protein
MTRLICALVLFSVIVHRPVVLAQAPPATPQMEGSASDAFATAAGQASHGFLGMKTAFEAMMVHLGLTRTQETELLGGGWSSNWQGENASGFLAVHAELPALLNKTQNYFSIVFQPAKETAIPPVLLSHLLSKATETSISGGDLVDIKLPTELSRMGCGLIYTLQVRLTSGALVSNKVSSLCDVTKSALPAPQK